MKQSLRIFFTLFLVSNAFLYLFIIRFHTLVPFSDLSYNGVHHYFTDPRVEGKKFDFLRAMGQMDAQWYLKIADTGYPRNPTDNFVVFIGTNKIFDGHIYAFFPLYPLSIRFINYIFNNIELSAFILSNIFLILNFFSLYYVIQKLYSSSMAIKTIFLIFLFPLSIFFRSYFTEGLYLFFLVWFSYFLIKKRWFWSAVCLGLLNVTKANGFLFNLYFFYLLWREFKVKKITFHKFIYFFIIAVFPILLWMLYCYIQTHNPLYFVAARSAWLYGLPAFLLPLYVFYWVLQFPRVGLFYSLGSFLDTGMILFIGLIFFLFKKEIDKKLWWIGFLFWLGPLLVTTSQSFARYQIVSFPLFLILAKLLTKKTYWIVLMISLIDLCLVSIYFVNWYWFG